MLLRIYEIEGAPAETAVEFLGQPRNVTELNLLEEHVASGPRQTLRTDAFGIRTLQLGLTK